MGGKILMKLQSLTTITGISTRLQSSRTQPCIWEFGHFLYFIPWALTVSIEKKKAGMPMQTRNLK